MGELSPWHWVIVLLVFALLFGSRKLPDAARSLGRSMRIFRAEMRSTQEEPIAPAVAEPTPPAAAPVQDAVPPPPTAT
jgi:sec-independent protein translocase protein TatA